MAIWWVSLEIKWKLQDVQAGINVVITSLSFLASFIFIRLCWQRTARHIVHGNTIPPSSLFIVSNPGEVFDLVLLRQKLPINLRISSLSTQCIVVVCLSATALLSGLIARYSARYGAIVRQHVVIGSAPNLRYGGIDLLNVETNHTLTRLKNANFPLNQLPEFLPVSTAEWIYNPSQWNSSWTMNCTQKPEFVLAVDATGICGNLTDEIPQVKAALGYQARDDPQWRSSRWWKPGTKATRDMLAFFHSRKIASAGRTGHSLSIMLAAVHLHEPPAVPLNETQCRFGKGPIKKVTITQATCTVRNENVTNNQATIVHPEAGADLVSILDSWRDYYGPTFLRQSVTNATITIPAPDELIRFYQTYMLLKDTQTSYRVSRPIDVRTIVVQISTVFLVVSSITSIGILYGLVHYFVFLYRHRHPLSNVPQSKLDWMIRSVESEDRSSRHSNSYARHTTAPNNIRPATSPVHHDKKAEYQDTRYAEFETIPWYSHNPPTPSSFSSTTNLARDKTGIYRDEGPLDTTYHAFSQVAASATYPLRTLAGYQFLNDKSPDRSPNHRLS